MYTVLTQVTSPLLETSRKGYLAAQSASAYSMVSLVQRFGPQPQTLVNHGVVSCSAALTVSFITR